ncbi:MAG: type 1 periplasmic binding fold superfamily protein [Flavobacteriales bacterium]
MITNLKYSTLLLASVLVLNGCNNDHDEVLAPPPPTNEEELITTVTLHFHSANDVEHKHFEFRDLDGDGGNPPIITADTLSADSVYEVSIEVLDESGTVAEDITAEILAEDEDHQFFFQFTNANATVAYDDADSNGNPIGLATIWTMGAASDGSLVLTLRHQPDKDGAGVDAGDITNAGGETDVEVNFPVVIE